jgi:hypothetical protein
MNENLNEQMTSDDVKLLTLENLKSVRGQGGWVELEDENCGDVELLKVKSGKTM